MQATRFPPDGARGVGPGRAAGYGYRLFDYLAAANQSLLLAIQVETAEGLANIDEIAAVDGIDLIFIGPGDLSVSIGAMGPDNRARLDAAILSIAGRRVGIFRPSTDDIGTWRAAGITFFLVASDTMFLGASLAAAMDAARDAASA